tara:strand:+ start:2256 stop:2819 length:564 start_codon:yes stop_codon:yes gene_type:complete
MSFYRKKLTIFFVLVGILMSMCSPSVFAKSNDTLLFKLPCSDDALIKPTGKSKNCLPATLILNSEDIQCISLSAELQHKNATIDDLYDTLTRRKSKLKKTVKYNNEIQKIYFINFTLRELAANRLSQFTRKNIGRPLNMSHKDELLSQTVIIAELSSHFKLPLHSEEIFHSIKNYLNVNDCSNVGSQ